MIIIAWVLYYLWTSFWPSLIWGTCGNDWNSPECYSTVGDIECQYNNPGNASDRIFYRGDCRTIQEICQSQVGRQLVGVNMNYCFDNENLVMLPIGEVINRTLSAEEFF